MFNVWGLLLLIPVWQCNSWKGGYKHYTSWEPHIRNNHIPCTQNLKHEPNCVYTQPWVVWERCVLHADFCYSTWMRGWGNFNCQDLGNLFVSMGSLVYTDPAHFYMYKCMNNIVSEREIYKTVSPVWCFVMFLPATVKQIDVEWIPKQDLGSCYIHPSASNSCELSTGPSF